MGIRLSADATCMRARIRRVNKDTQAKAAAADHRVATAREALDSLANKRSLVKLRMDSLQNDLARMVKGFISEERRWDSELNQAFEERLELEAAVERQSRL